MSFDGSGNYSVPYTFVYDTVISETEMNAQFADIATALSTCMTKDGQTTIAANIPFNNYKITGLAAGTAATDGTNLGQVQAQAWKWGGTAGGTADALTLTPSPAITAYAAGQSWRFIAGASPNTGAATVAVSGLTTKAIQNNGSTLAAGDIAAGKMYEITYDGTQFQLNHVVSLSLSGYLQSSDIGVTVQGYDADTLKADTSDTLTAGFDTTSYSTGNTGAGTVTLSVANGNVQNGTVTGSFTMGAPTFTQEGYIEWEIINDGTGGYSPDFATNSDKVVGTYDDTAGNTNLIRITKMQSHTVVEILNVDI